MTEPTTPLQKLQAWLGEQQEPRLHLGLIPDGESGEMYAYATVEEKLNQLIAESAEQAHDEHVAEAKRVLEWAGLWTTTPLNVFKESKREAAERYVAEMEAKDGH